ncbi:MAG: hypothetical protein CM1200mP15_21420 [Dehalococcoidia bacterium]|nr:MAG: hypothetical protein CM1200mP15_21420 [Dehalococcoidia bacterium]
MVNGNNVHAAGIPSIDAVLGTRRVAILSIRSRFGIGYGGKDRLSR